VDLAEAVEFLGWGPCGSPIPGDIDRAGTDGGGPGSAAGDLLCIDLWDVVGACISAVPAGEKGDAGHFSTQSSSYERLLELIIRPRKANTS
jgi:hypothetical protein